MAILSMREMLEAGAHFGHQTHKWNPKMRPYIYGPRNGVHIINLQLTQRMFDKAYAYVRDQVAAGESVLFIGTKKQAQDIVKREADRCGAYFIAHRWLGGTLTNFVTIRKALEKYNDLNRMKEEGGYPAATKKEALQMERERLKMARNFEGLSKMTKLPGLAFVIDPHLESIAVKECRRAGVPLVAMTDTNCDPDPIDFIIPANDDAIRSVELFAARIADAVIEGRSLLEQGRRDEGESRRESTGPRVSRGKVAVRGERLAPAPVAAPAPEAEAETPDTEAPRAAPGSREEGGVLGD